jgi:hypothetical protein
MSPLSQQEELTWQESPAYSQQRTWQCERLIGCFS